MFLKIFIAEVPRWGYQYLYLSFPVKVLYPYLWFYDIFMVLTFTKSWKTTNISKPLNSSPYIPSSTLIQPVNIYSPLHRTASFENPCLLDVRLTNYYMTKLRFDHKQSLIRGLLLRIFFSIPILKNRLLFLKGYFCIIII